MWDDSLPDIVERDGQKWLRVRAFEKDADMRAWTKVPSDYEFHEGDVAYLALAAQVNIWKRVAPILKVELPATLTDLAESIYPDAAKRFADLARRHRAAWEGLVVAWRSATILSESKPKRKRSRPKQQET